jgi:hypothetical protein
MVIFAHARVLKPGAYCQTQTDTALSCVSFYVHVANFCASASMLRRLINYQLGRMWKETFIIVEVLYRDLSRGTGKKTT